jgi:hypothetical protein
MAKESARFVGHIFCCSSLIGANAAVEVEDMRVRKRKSGVDLSAGYICDEQLFQ